jgi:hypothetical protein
MSEVSLLPPARQSLQAAYISHLRGQVAPRRRAETPATVEPAVPENLLASFPEDLVSQTRAITDSVAR